MNQFLLPLLGLLLLTTFLGWRATSPALAIINRWLRWIVFSLGLAALVIEFGWSERPVWLLFFTFFLCWFLLETIYNWVLVGILNWSNMPLFPTYSENQNGDEWPTQPRYIRLREWLREAGFQSIAAVKAPLEDTLVIRSSIYQSSCGTVRIQVTFVPHRLANVFAYYSLVSILEDGRRIITDNVRLPFGGYFPADWEVQRRPLCASLEKLYKGHIRRCKRAGSALRPWSVEGEDPIEELNRQQERMEKTNTDQGFLLPGMYREEYGNLSMEGRYRIWKEIWLLNYFGKTVASR